MERPSFNPKPVTCKLCGDSIKSSYEGEYVSCKCGAIAVDQTAYYMRGIGDYENFIFEEDDNHNSSS